ncbi:MAG: hypothetical protein LIP03_02120 [Bacteroidales bacterium]|nr:hypothetical protein [Bacteroidales bacterium]
MKKIKFLSMLLLMATISIGFSACGGGDDEPEYDWGSSDSSSSSSSSSSSVDYESLISSNVTATAKYNDYAFDITFKTTLASALSGVTPKHGIVCGYGSYDYVQYFTVTGTSYSTTLTIFIDLVYPEEALYYNSYKAIQVMEKPWSSSTTDLYNECVKYMDKAIKNGAKDYQGRIFVEISGTRYYVKSFSY